MSMSDEYRDWQDETVKVVKNMEGYCSIWPADKENPAGWEDVGVCGTKAECLTYIKENCDENAYLRG
jgi:MbtH protein